MRRGLLSDCRSVVWVSFVHVSGYIVGIDVHLEGLGLKWTRSCNDGRGPVVLGGPCPGV